MPWWVLPAISFAGGSVVATFFTYFFTSWRNRKQPVGYRLSTDPILRPNREPAAIDAKVVITTSSGEHKFSNLFRTRIELTNLGNRDLDQFTFNVAMKAGDPIVFVEMRGMDNSHVPSCSSAVSPGAVAQTLDFTCTPSNRGDEYAFDLFTVITDDKPEPIEPVLSSSHAVVLSRVKSVSDALGSLGPITVRYNFLGLGFTFEHKPDLKQR